MEPHAGSYELVAASSLSRDQLEVYRLFQMCGLTLSNEKFQVGLTFLSVAVIWIVLSGAVATCVPQHSHLLHHGPIARHLCAVKHETNVHCMLIPWMEDHIRIHE